MTTENEQLAAQVSQSTGTTAEELVERKQGSYQCPLSQLRERGALSATRPIQPTVNPFGARR